MMYTVKRINADDENLYLKPKYVYGNLHCLVHLGIFGEKAAQLINAALKFKYVNLRTPIFVHESGDVVGGGLLIKCRSEVYITSTDEVCLLFKRFEDLNKYVRNAVGMAEVTAAIKNRLANTLKEFWQYHDVDEKTVTDYDKEGRDIYITYSKDDYRVLYEVLKGRNQQKLIGKYGDQAFNEMVGKQTENPLAISMIEALKRQICQEISEREEALNKLKEQYNNELNELYKKYDSDGGEITHMSDMKIKELEVQIRQLMFG